MYKNYKKHKGGGAPPAPLLSKKEGLNRFVWDMGHFIMPSIPDVYIEANFRGHKAPPGTYTIQLKANGKTVGTQGKIISMPTFEIKEGQYEAYDKIMIDMEQKLTTMHTMVNSLYKAKGQLNEIWKDVKDGPLKIEGKRLADQIDIWDKKMVQRKSQAYDDVENFPNKFTAEYLFLINATESSIPRVNQPSKDRKTALDAQWLLLKKEGEHLIKSAIPEYNKKLWDSGIGAIRI